MAVVRQCPTYPSSDGTRTVLSPMDTTMHWYPLCAGRTSPVKTRSLPPWLRSAGLVAGAAAIPAGIIAGGPGRVLASHALVAVTAVWVGRRVEHARLWHLERIMRQLEETYGVVVEQLWWLRRELEVRDLMRETGAQIDGEPGSGTGSPDRG